MVPTCKVSPRSASLLSSCSLPLYPPSSTRHPTSLSVAAFWHEALNISSAPLDFPFARPALFMKPPLLSVESNWYYFFFSPKCIYTKSWCVALWEDMQAFRVLSWHTVAAVVLKKAFLGYFIISALTQTQVMQKFRRSFVRYVCKVLVRDIWNWFLRTTLVKTAEVDQN